jgi:hypothetical protein
MKLPHFLVLALSLFLGQQLFATAATNAHCPLKEWHHYYLNVSGGPAWSKFDGWAVAARLGCRLHEYERGFGAFELETGYIYEDETRTSKGEYELVHYAPATPSSTILLRPDEYRKAKVKMVPLMLNYVYHAHLGKWLDCECANAWTLSLGAGVGLSFNRQENSGHVKTYDGLNNLIATHPFSYRKNDCSPIGQIFARLGVAVTDCVGVFVGGRGIFTEKYSFGKGNPTAMETDVGHFVLDAGVNIKF